MSTGNLRRRLGVVLVAMVAALTAVLVSAPPAQAEEVEKYRNAGLGQYYTLSFSAVDRDAIAKMESWPPLRYWSVEHKGWSASGHRLVMLRAQNDRCLDSHAEAAGGRAWVIACNGAEYQVWEVFHQGNAIVFKSWGAWVRQGRHLCVAANGAFEVRMRVCNVYDVWQQWY